MKNSLKKQLPIKVDEYFDLLPEEFRKEVIHSEWVAGKLVYRMNSKINFEEYLSLAKAFLSPIV